VRRSGWQAIIKLLLAPLLAGLAASLCLAAPAPTAHELLDELNHVGLDAPQSYKVSDIYVRRDAIRIHLEHGKLVFLQPVRGRITGAIFEGAGQALVLPPDRMERAQLLKFSGSPILTESFASAYFRFTDHTYAEVIQQIRTGKGRPENAPELLRRWEPLLPGLNQVHSLRILLDYLQSPAAPYFYAGINGERLGLFDVIVDDRRQEPVLVGQLRWDEEQRYYDVWASFERRESVRLPPPAHITAYRIDATITPEQALQVDCELDLEMQQEYQQVLVFELSRLLQVEQVTELPASGTEGAPRQLEFLQNATLTAEEARYRGTDIVAVVLPAALPSPPAKASARRTLRFRYQGQVITDVGAGVLHVGARQTWYPTVEPMGPAHFRLHFRYPPGLELVAVGRRQSYQEKGNWQESLWVTDVPLPLAGFNIGDYESLSLEGGEYQVNVYANRHLEPRLAAALRPVVVVPHPKPGPGGRALESPPVQPTVTPEMQLAHVGREMSGALDYYTRLFGPVPYAALNASPTPGQVAQGYPGLLYLSTYSYLSEDVQLRLGLDENAREHFSQVIPAHETAHQWWGNWVTFPGYRSQWLAEALATYSALLYLDQEPEGPGSLRKWLERYRANLLEEDEEGNAVDATGSLALGSRLSSSLTPKGYITVIYNKGAWVIHMLRELLRDPVTGSDAIFLSALRDLAAHGGEQPLDNNTFERRFEAALPAYADIEGNGKLDWFFQEWVFDTGIPRYELDWEAQQRAGHGWSVTGVIEQSGVPDTFTMPVPVYARFGNTLSRLGRVVVTGALTPFEFRVESEPDAVILDPHMTVLSQTP
jgi:hypothetical protein